MDIGFGKFLEIFEDRFGRRLTTALIALIGASVAVFCISLIWLQAIQPLSDAVRDLPRPTRNDRLSIPRPTRESVDASARVIVAMAITVSGLAILERLRQLIVGLVIVRGARRALDSAEQAADRASSLQDKTYSHLMQLLSAQGISDADLTDLESFDQSLDKRVDTGEMTRDDASQ